MRAPTAALAALLCCALPARAQEVAGPAEQIRAVLESMEQAVRTPDPDAYLAHVWGGSGEFYREQRAWAEDLRTHTPDRFDLDLLSERVEPVDGVATVRLRMLWSFPDSTPRSVEFDADFIRVPEALGGPWLYMGEHFDRFPASKATIMTMGVDRRTAFALGRTMSQVIGHVERGLRRSVDRVTPVRFYDSLDHLNASIALSRRSGETWYWRPGQSIKALAPAPEAPPEALAADLTRMYCAVAFNEFGAGVAGVPYWVRAGLTELAAERYEQDADDVTRQVRAWAVGGELVPWEDLATDDGSERTRAHAAAQGHHFLGYLYERFGRGPRNAWFDALASGASLEEATQAVFDMPFADLARQWFQALVTIDDQSPP